jgi:hypothetical protein
MADYAGLEVSIRQTNGGHFRVTFMDDRREVSVFMANTPSDIRSDHNAVAGVRWAIRKMEGSVQ